MEITKNRNLEFVQLHQESESRLKELDKKFSLISTLRILTFLAGAAMLAIGVSDGKTFIGICGAVLLAGFVFLVGQHSIVAKKQEIESSICEVTNRYVSRFSDDWRKFEDTGADLMSKEDVVAADIDLLGPNSLYQMISVCHTEEGRKILGTRLKTRNVDEDLIDGRQQAVMELSEKRKFAISYEAAGMRLSRNKRKLNVEEFEEYCKDEKSGVLPVWAKVVRVLFPIAELVFLVLWLTGVTHYGYFLAGFIVLLSLSWLTTTVTAGVVLPVTAADTVIDAYEEMLGLIAKEDFESDLLLQIKQKVSGEKGAKKAFHQLHGISQAHNISFNPLIHQVLSGLILWDYQLAAKVEKWKKEYGGNVAGCFQMIGEMEELLSLAVLPVVRETSLPEVYFDTERGKAVSLSADIIYHPLIKPEQVVGNSAKLDAGITIITGSNMSGKTTYLRTLAVNLVLAYIGAPVCGNSFKASYMKLFTSMRVTDDVANGISTFYAEILRIKNMAEYRKENQPMLCLIDEIFKGTNSADRIVGAREVITGLAGDRCMTVVSTHDFELCSIQDRNGKDAVNFHFEEYYEEDELKFDYSIKNGRCTSTNARAILRMAGFSVQDA